MGKQFDPSTNAQLCYDFGMILLGVFIVAWCARARLPPDSAATPPLPRLVLA